MSDIPVKTLKALSDDYWDISLHIVLAIIYTLYVILSYFKDKEVKKWIINNRSYIINLEQRINNIDKAERIDVSKIDTDLKTTLGFVGYFLYFAITLCYLILGYKMYTEMHHFKKILRVALKNII